MAEKTKRKPYLQAAVYGIASLVSYIFLFKYAGSVTEYTTIGGIYAALPILAAFYFSFLHGAFASNVLSVIGLEAAKKKK